MLTRRVLGGAVALTCVVLLSSCSLLPKVPSNPGDNDPDQVANAEMQRIADAVKQHDRTALTKLFSPSARDKATDLDGGLKYFLSFFPSGRMSWKLMSLSAQASHDFSKESAEVYATYKVAAEGKNYTLYLADVSTDNGHAEVDGIYSLGIATYTANPETASGKLKPLFAWEGTGDPGVYVPQR
jgi:hypothetical protein